MNKIVASVLVAGFASTILVGAKYKFWSDSLFADERGFTGQFSPIGLAYTNLFDAFYWPGRTVAKSAFRFVPYGGVAIDLSSDLVAASLQNLACIAIWFRLRRTTSNRSSRLP